jgi:hypothetical protein
MLSPTNAGPTPLSAELQYDSKVTEGVVNSLRSGQTLNELRGSVIDHGRVEFDLTKDSMGDTKNRFTAGGLVDITKGFYVLRVKSKSGVVRFATPLTRMRGSVYVPICLAMGESTVEVKYEPVV